MTDEQFDYALRMVPFLRVNADACRDRNDKDWDIVGNVFDNLSNYLFDLVQAEAARRGFTDERLMGAIDMPMVKVREAK